MHRARLAFLSLLCLVAASSGRAETSQQEVVISVNYDEFAKIVQDLGYRAEILTNNDGKRRIRTRIAGWNVTINLYSCEEKERCKSVGLRTFFKNDKNKALNFANDWNQTKRFAKVYIDKDNDVNVEYDFLFRNGVTKGNIRAYFDVYEDQLKEFVEAMNK